jgi:hypothetical protein
MEVQFSLVVAWSVSKTKHNGSLPRNHVVMEEYNPGCCGSHVNNMCHLI